MAWLIAALLMLAALMGAGCGLVKEEQARGGGLEGETLTLAGTVLYADGTPAVSARVRLRTSDFPEKDSSEADIDTVTGPDGSYTFTGVHPGNFFIIANDKDSLAHFKEVIADDSDANMRLLQLGADTLKTKGYIRGRVLLPPGASPALKGLVQLPMDGSPFAIDSTGTILIKSVPPGTYFLRIVYTSPDMIHKMENVKVKAGETTDVGTYTLAPPESENISTWPDSVSFHLNTTATGAGITEDLAGFPVLIRLDSTNFPFDKVGEKKDGADLRFTDSRGKSLPFEMELWDLIGRRAVLWVRPDTLHANRNDQTIRLHFGNPDVFSPANPHAVFDTAFGHAAVWHFSHYNSGDWLSDATPNNNQLLSGNTEIKSGLIAQGRQISAGDAMGAPPAAAQELSAFTLSAWIHSNGAQSDHAVLIWKQRPGFTIAAYSLCWLGKEGAVEFSMVKDPAHPVAVSIKAPLPLGEAWIHVAATFDPSGAGALYIDGKVVATLKDTAPIAYVKDGTLFLGGRLGGVQAFNGILDEVRVEKVAWSAARIAAEYASEKTGSSFVVFP